MPKNSENNGTKDIGLVTPTPDEQKGHQQDFMLLHLTQAGTHAEVVTPQQTHYVIITSLLRQNGVVLTF